MSRKDKVRWVEYEGRESLAIKQLEETLHVDLTRGALYDMNRHLTHAIDRLPLKERNEILFQSDAGATALVLRQVWDAATPTLIGRQLVQVFRDDEASLKVPIAAKAQARWIKDGGEIPISEEAYSFKTIDAKKSGLRPAITREMIEDAHWDVLARQLEEGARAMGEFESTEIIGKQITDAGSTVAAASSGTLAWADVAGMIGTMGNLNRPPDILAVNWTEFADLLKDSAIQNLVLYDKQDAFVPGGPIAYVPGMKILVSSLVTSATALLVNSRYATALFLRRDITIEDYEDPKNDLQGAVFTERWNHETIDANAIGTVTDA